VIDHPVWLVLVILATARVVRFVCDDYLSKDFRLWVLNKFGDDSKISYLVHCRWCVAIWVCAAVVPFSWFGTGHLWAQIPITILAVALVAPAVLSINELKPQITVNSREGEPWR
jgi:hypothetical protein